MKAKHTPEPWRIVNEHPQKAVYYIFPHKGRNCYTKHCGIASISRYTNEKTHLADAERIVACVNGCEGLNPAAYREVHSLLVEAVKEAITNDWLRRARKCLKKAKEN
jgi:hypothetical protein